MSARPQHDASAHGPTRASWVLLRGLVAPLLTVALLILPFARPAAGGKLRPCCSDPGVFCVLPFVGGAPACGGFGGVFSLANVCTNEPRCAVAFQLKVQAEIDIEIPVGAPAVLRRLEGTADQVPIEMVELQLQSVDPALPPMELRQSPTRPSPGQLNPPNSFPADSFYDLFYELDFPAPTPLGANTLPQEIQALQINSFPALGVPYQSTGPVTLFDGVGRPVARVVSLTLIFLLPPTTAPTVSPWGWVVLVALLAAVAYVGLHRQRQMGRPASR